MIKNLGIKIIGTGSYSPDFVVKNDDFSPYIETDDEWISTRTGIKQRNFNIKDGKNGKNTDMAVKAAENALSSSGVKADEIDMVIASTSTPDCFYPTLSCVVQNKIKAVNAGAFDMSAACTGFIYALDTARAFLATGSYKKILIVASEMMSNHIDFTDRSNCVLFGDGAGAVIVETAEKEYCSYIAASGEAIETAAIKYELGYSNNSPFAKAESDEKLSGYIALRGKDVYKFATDIMPKAVEEVCKRAEIALSDIDLLIPHQANIRIINTAMKNLDIPREKVYVNIQNTGNISSACIPVCLDELRLAGRLKDGMKVCLVGFGGGLTYGAVVFEI